jgi:protocatechuate 3,4-dioxygenase beta subunit
LLGLVDQEVSRLPARYRDVIVLCDLEGRTYTEAARRLRCPLGTVQSRLARGRDQLRGRLVRRGVGATAGTALLAECGRAAVPEALREATLRATEAVWSGRAFTATGIALIERLLRATTSASFPRIAGAAAAIIVALGTSLAISGIGNSRGEQPTRPVSTVLPHAKPDPEPAVQPDHDRTVLLEVRRAEDNKPLSGAAVWVQTMGGRSRVATLGRTGDAGRYPVELGDGPISSVTVVVAAEGHVPKQLRWEGDNLPANPVAGLERGVQIGGRVVDEQGRPIEGARVLPRKYVTTGAEAAAVTDAAGRWQSHSLAAAALADGKPIRLEFRVTHADFIAASQAITSEQARAQSSVQTMEHGGSLSGRVIGPDGKPVARALVAMGQPNDASYQTETDASGHFQFGRCLDPKWSSTELTVQAPGLAAFVRELLVTPTIPQQIIALDGIRPLRGRVVDSQGKPVVGASVWPTQLGYARLDWRAVTDAQGRFEWAEAPTSGSIGLDLHKSGFEEAVGRRFEASQREVTITLHRPLHLHGTVTEAVNHQPIDHFDLIPGWGPDRPGGRVEWLRQDSNLQRFSNGRFDLRGGLFPDQGFNRSIRIEAEGYLPAELIGFRDDAEDIARDFTLHKAVSLSGVVRGHDGKPLAGADVALSSSDNDVRIENGRMVSNRVVGEATHQRTGQDGRYTFRPQEKTVAVVVVHDAGFAVRTPAELAATTDVTVSPWGRIEGVLKVGSHSAPRRKVSAWMANQSFSGRVDYDTQTDEQGGFAFERVTPGAITVYRYVENQDNRSWTPSNPVFVEVGPGQSLHVQVGGNGRPVIGRLLVPQGFSLANLVCAPGELSTVRSRPRQPDDFPDYTDEQQSAWYERFYQTAAGKAYYQGERKYAVDLRPDGTFRFEDVPAGQYVLELHFVGRTNQDNGGLYGAAHSSVKVPAIHGGRSDALLDLGAIRLDVFRLRELKVGDPAPTITRNAADGRPIDLGALRGKFVLLHFWETYQARSLADLPVLEETYEAFGRDPHFVMIGLNQDEDFDLPKRYAARKGFSWEQRHVGLERPNPVTAEFGVRFPPEVMLIGPDGRLVARDLKGPEIKQAVAKALGQSK